ncbi:hypothetical protein DFH07DRAFT_999129 [Mycena maculata]|uniref:Uncharacterized protein n=1 Tax=Mycena maculata TaxID=230809 RepID=A0AAD7MRV8_9AGAR|nr:hypothetical protein DFH07DRAFT_999129 [Mycena maculata]
MVAIKARMIRVSGPALGVGNSFPIWKEGEGGGLEEVSTSSATVPKLNCNLYCSQQEDRRLPLGRSDPDFRHSKKFVRTFGLPGLPNCVLNNAAAAIGPFKLTVDGPESQIAVNHVRHFLFTKLVLPKLLATKTATYTLAPARGYKKWELL